MKSLAIPSFILICAAVAKGYRLESNGLASNSASMPPGTDEEEVPRALPAGFPASTNKEHDKPIHQVVQETSFAEDAGTSVVPGTEGQDRGSARDVQQITNMQRKHKTKVPVHASEMKELASVVKIFVNTVKADFVSPWQMMAPKEHSGSGFVVEGQMIMTNAHLVADQTRVLVRKHGNPKRFLAKVIAVCHECDLALVTVDDGIFWRGLQPLAFGGVPHLRESVVVLGYPTGGDQLSITEGVVSRVGVSMYAHSYFGLLTVQIDAPINPGNSGGPAISAGKVVGVAFQGFSEMQNVGYIVPYPVIRHFLNDIALHRRHTGIVSMGIKAQTMENDALKQFKGLHTLPPEALPENVTASGVLVLSVDKLRSNLYMQGKIALPISRYEQLQEARDNCELGAATEKMHTTASAEDCQGRCPIKKKPCPALVEDQPPGEADDGSAQQRDVKEVPSRVIWQPQNWASSRPPSACILCSSQRSPNNMNAESGPIQVQAKGRPSSAPPAVLTSLRKSEEERMANGEATGQENNTEHSAATQEETDEEELPQQNLRISPAVIDVEIAVRAVKEEDKITNAGTESAKDETAALRDESSASNAELKKAPSQSTSTTKGVFRNRRKVHMEGEKERNEISWHPEENPEAESSHHSTDNFVPPVPASTTTPEERPAPATREAAPTAAEESFLPPRAKLESLLHKLLVGKSTIRQIRSLLRTPENELNGPERRKDGNFGVNNGFTQNREHKTSPTTQNASSEQVSVAVAEQQEAPTSKMQKETKSKLGEEDAAMQQATKQEQLKEQLNAPNRPNQEENGKSKTSDKDVTLAAPVHTLVDNPYFDSRLLDEEEFLGFREGDVILSIGKYNVADDGTVSFRNLERVDFSYVITEYFNGQTTWAYVLREGRVIKVTVPLMTPNFKVAPFTWDTRPSYFVYGGFVFTPLSKMLLTAKLRKDVPNMFEYFVQRLDYQEKEGEEFVVLSLILASEISVGYEQPPCIVRSVNGRAVRSMRDLVHAVEETKEQFIELQVETNAAETVLLVIDRHKAESTNNQILKEHNIAQAKSEDLQQL